MSLNYTEIQAVVRAIESKISTLECFVKGQDKTKPITVGEENRLNSAKEELKTLKEALRKF